MNIFHFSNLLPWIHFRSNAAAIAEKERLEVLLKESDDAAASAADGVNYVCVFVEIVKCDVRRMFENSSSS